MSKKPEAKITLADCTGAIDPVPTHEPLTTAEKLLAVVMLLALMYTGYVFWHFVFSLLLGV